MDFPRKKVPRKRKPRAKKDPNNTEGKKEKNKKDPKSTKEKKEMNKKDPKSTQEKKEMNKKDPKGTKGKKAKNKKDPNNNNKVLLVCSFCHAMFVQHLKLISHMSSCHPEEILTKMVVEDVDVDIAMQTRTNTFLSKDESGKEAEIIHVEIELFEYGTESGVTSWLHPSHKCRMNVT